MNLDILDRFTHHLRNALSRSIDLAWELKQEVIPPVYLLVGLSEQRGSIGSSVLQSSNISTDALKKYLRSGSAEVELGVTEEAGPSIVFLWPEFSDATKQMIERATMIALEMNQDYVGTEHLLYALVDQPDDDIVAVLERSKQNSVLVKKRVATIMKQTQQLGVSEEQGPPVEGDEHHHHSATPSAPSGRTPRVQTNTIAPEPQEDVSETPALDYFGTDLTSKEQQAKLDPVIGREPEIERLIHVLSRRGKNNPVLIGDPGVGKTAIVEGLARRIVSGDVPDVLLGKRVVSLDLSSVLAGTMYRGEFEGRLRQLIDELRRFTDIILFIDEIHMLVGAGGVQGGTMDAANILKPALAKGDVRCIGATTADEYRRTIEQDAALERRFQAILIEEPSEEQAVDIIRGLRQYFETFHHITISDEVIRVAVQYAIRFIPEKRLPDKAIDLIDEAGAKKAVERRVPESAKKLKRYRTLLTQLRKKKDQAVQSERFTLAVELKKKERVLEDRVAALHAQQKQAQSPATAITVEDVAHVLARMKQLPIEHIIASTQERFSTMEAEIRSSLVGQERAVDSVISVLKRSHTGLSAAHRPLGSFLFLGPSGVGKTALAKIVAKSLFGRSDNLIRLDMAEFSEGFTMSKMLGAPAGYVGYNERPTLMEQIRRKPYSVVLFDEIEKAHPDMYNVLLHILDEGRLTDATGRELNFRNSVIIMTSNIGIDLLTKQAALGFEQEKTNTKEVMPFEEIEKTIFNELDGYFPLEFLNRIDHRIVFRPLTIKDIEAIVNMQCAEVRERLQKRGIGIRLLAPGRRALARMSFHPQQGARLVQRTVLERVENPLADALLAGTVKQGDTITVTATSKGELQLKNGKTLMR